MLRPAAFAILMLACPLAAATTERPLRVTTDSRAYCSELAARFAAQPQPPPASLRQLAEDGQRLCDSGHVRTGIAKLRRALRAAQNADQGMLRSPPFTTMR